MSTHFSKIPLFFLLCTLNKNGVMSHFAGRYIWYKAERSNNVRNAVEVCDAYTLSIYSILSQVIK